MRLKRHLNEKVNVLDTSKELNEKIHNDCQKYLKLIEGKYPAMRGMDEWIYGKKEVRKNRKPKGMDPEVFRLFNNGLEENGHNRRDQSIIATTSPEVAQGFGNPYYIFPIGNFSYTWIQAFDVNLDDERTGGYMGVVGDYFSDYGEYEVELDMDFGKYFITDKGFDKAYKNGFEIGFDCKEYYYFSYRAASNIVEGDVKEQIFKPKD